MVHERVAECYVGFLVAILSLSQESIFGFVLNSEVVCSLTYNRIFADIFAYYQRKAYLASEYTIKLLYNLNDR